MLIPTCLGFSHMNHNEISLQALHNFHSYGFVFRWKPLRNLSFSLNDFQNFSLPL